MTYDEMMNIGSKKWVESVKPEGFNDLVSEIRKLQSKLTVMSLEMEVKAFNIRDDILAELREKESQGEDVDDDLYNLKYFMNEVAWLVYPFDTDVVYANEYVDHEDINGFWEPSTC